MKAFIYVGIGLFSFATIFGMADYYKADRTGTLERLYKEDNHLTSKEGTAEKISKKEKGLKPDIELEDFSRGKIEAESLPLIETTGVKSGEASLTKVEVKTIAVKSKKISAKRSKPAKRINLKMFSRAIPEAPAKRE
jgi:hypothetical protein